MTQNHYSSYICLLFKEKGADNLQRKSFRQKATLVTRQLLKNMWTKPINAFNSEGVLIKEFPFGALSIGRNLHISGKKIWELCCSNSNEIYEEYIWKFA